MSDAIEVAESCRCGGSTTVKGLSLQNTHARVTEWRATHRCLGPDEQPKAPEPSGSGSYLGFAPNPWDHDRGPVLR